MPGRNSPYHRAPASDSDDYFFSDDTDNGNLLAGPHVLADLAHQDMHSEDRTNLDDIEVYRMRWLTLCLFGFLTLSNAVLFVTFAVSKILIFYLYLYLYLYLESFVLIIFTIM